MKWSRRWARRRCRVVGEDGLVAVAVFLGVVAVDVWGERHVAYFVEDGVEVGDWVEAQSAFAKLSGSDYLRLQQWFRVTFGSEVEVFAGLDFLAGSDQRRPIVLAKSVALEGLRFVQTVRERCAACGGRRGWRRGGRG